MYTLFCIWLSISSLSATDPVKTVRSELTKIQSVNEVNHYLRQLESDNSPEAKGYTAALIFIKSREFNSPFKKMRFFNLAKKKMEQVINSSPNHIELRYLRYSIQKTVPEFLGYSQNVEEDLNFIKNKILCSTIFESIKAMIINNIIKIGNLHPNDLVELQLVLKQLR
jgi:hypothetical protein